VGSIIRKLGSPQTTAKVMTMAYVAEVEKRSDHLNALRRVLKSRYSDMPPDVVEKIIDSADHCLAKIVMRAIKTEIEALPNGPIAVTAPAFLMDLQEAGNGAVLRCRCEGCQDARQIR